ncbi:Oidioi.mRNA.OKI2018_I69.PAR.g10764.t1.cds [Oikopleura dioica]|uniref:Oidioi.mRNA.OKI2018_I69.PAR.g10764.t1.cds n=1 Tax=Oikopleura dioica TaxID=34765 RepID=A0ABN7RZM1_OIKDI|nr:Oidioi.mRNA.OKI2018_I69.PAR.g10764.t1.cds [Oikopleura dioica]
MDERVQTVEQVDAATEEIPNDAIGFFILWGFVFTLIFLGIVLESIKKYQAKKKSKETDPESSAEEAPVEVEEVELQAVASTEI